jgi:hypothetical protein
MQPMPRETSSGEWPQKVFVEAFGCSYECQLGGMSKCDRVVRTYYQLSYFDDRIVPVNIREEDVIGFETCVS